MVTFSFFTLPNFLPISTNVSFSDYRTDYSEGICTTLLNSCQWAGEGCGGGHGKCTSLPQLFIFGISTCDINMSFPANQGYKCTCLPSIGPLGKCGWEK